MQKAHPGRFEKVALLRVRVRCTGAPRTDNGQSLVGSPLAHRGQVYPADVHVRRVVARPRAVNGRIARPLLLPGWVAAVDCGCNQCSRQPYRQLSHRAVAVDHRCPHKAEAVLCPLVATLTSKKILCPTPRFRQPLQKGSNHQERLDCANKTQVPAIPEQLAPKLDELNNVSSFGDVFQCYHWRQLCVRNPPYEFF